MAGNSSPNNPSRRNLLQRGGTLSVVTPRAGIDAHAVPEDAFDLHVCLTDEGRTYAFNGHVDLGTGIRTALAQIVAEELDVQVTSVTMVLGDTDNTPNQGATIASETIQVASAPLRSAAAQARQHLIRLASAVLDCAADDMETSDGTVSARTDPSRSISYGDLLANRSIRLLLDGDVALKPVENHRVVGRPIERVDIPAKATGQFAYVHDVRVPGMLHGRVVRPPYSGMDSGEFIGRCIEAVDRESINHIPGIVAIVVEGDFVGVVAEREEYAAEAAESLKVRWKPWTFGRDLGQLETALRAEPVRSRRLVDVGNVDAALSAAHKRLDRVYVWPYQMHASIGPSCAVADVRPDAITVWSGTQNPFPLRADIALLTGLPEERVEIVRAEAAGCYGRNCADDAAADAVLLSRAVARPVRVQLTREQEHLWEPKGAGQLMDVSGALGDAGTLSAYDFQSRYPSNAAPTLALLLTGRIPPQPAMLQMGDRTALPAYRYENMRVTVHDMAPIVRASWLRGVSALPNVFAHECFIDELAVEAGADPVDFRLRHILDERAAELVKETAQRAGWEHRVGPQQHDDDAEVLRGRGFAQARYVHGTWPGTGAAWSAWVAEVAVNRSTGEVNVTRVVVGQDTGMMINPAGVRHQIHGNVIQSTSRVLREEVRFTETTAVAAREWGAYPIIAFSELPAIDVHLMERQHEPPMGAGESASVPSAAAIVNAVYDATGVRFRELPLTPERVLAGLGKPTAKPPREHRRRFPSLSTVTAFLVGVLGLGTVALPTQRAISPIARPDPAAYSASTIERGRILAALGACAVCHTAPGGAAYAGGMPLETPFGTVVVSNITPDPETGIGAWSYPAFERAMRQGIHRDGRHLYPAFPYPSFANASDGDLQAIYAYLMSQQPVTQTNPDSRLAFPFNIRPLMAGWNFLFNRSGTAEADPEQSAQWNRGRYLVDGLGHCGACHSPRNVLGAERKGRAYLAGGVAEGWEAPALTRLSRGPIPWSEAAFYTYLKTGASPDHGAAAGPMAPVIDELKALPDSDLRAMAVYLASFSEPLTESEADARRRDIIISTAATAHPMTSAAARLYENACASCHEPGRAVAPVSAGPPLGPNSKLHGERPDNFLHVVLDGIKGSPHAAMPGFREALDDTQIADLARYVRGRFAPHQPAWTRLEETVARLRTQTAK